MTNYLSGDIGLNQASISKGREVAIGNCVLCINLVLKVCKAQSIDSGEIFSQRL